jgi:hypothetical protein
VLTQQIEVAGDEVVGATEVVGQRDGLLAGTGGVVGP